MTTARDAVALAIAHADGIDDLVLADHPENAMAADYWRMADAAIAAIEAEQAAPEGEAALAMLDRYLTRAKGRGLLGGSFVSAEQLEALRDLIRSLSKPLEVPSREDIVQALKSVRVSTKDYRYHERQADAVLALFALSPKEPT